MTHVRRHSRAADGGVPRPAVVLPLPLALKLLEHVLGGEVEVDLGGGEVVVGEHELQRSGRAALVEPEDGEGMPQDVGTHPAGDLGAVRDAFHNALGGAGGEEDLVVKDEVVLEEGPQAVGEGHDAKLGALPVGAALALDADGALLPLDLVAGEVG